MLFMKVDVGDGRIYLPKDKREKYGDKFRVVELEKGIMLVPISDDPLEKLRDITSETEKSSEEIVERSRKAMIEEAGK